MKTLKIKFGLFSLLAVLAVSVFLTSCEQEQITPLIAEQEVEYISQGMMIMPFGIATDTEIVRENYMKNATPELMDKMTENGRVAYYLMGINKLEIAAKKMSYGDFFCDLDLTLFLTPTEIAELQIYDINSVINNTELRGCTETVLSCSSKIIGGVQVYCCRIKYECPWWQFWNSGIETECS